MLNKNAMKIGVYFTPRKEQGGVYQYTVEILEALNKIKGHKYVIITVSPDIPEKFINSRRFKLVDISSKARKFVLRTRDFMSGPFSLLTTPLVSVLFRLKLFKILTPIYKLSQLPYIKAIEEENLDLIFYPTSSDLSFLAPIPAVVTVHDLQHRISPNFKEVSSGGRWEHREYGFLNISKKAFRILVDSNIGKEDMIKFYHEAEGKVVVLPYLPPFNLNKKISKKVFAKVARKFRLPDKYIFYPSKFWPHKNHRNLIKALDYLNKKKGKKVNLVLTGSKDADFSSYQDVMNLVEKLGLQHQVLYLGYVSHIELSVIYKKALALVMPTYFGPTNIPILEAWLMGTPVITSNLRGCREQLGGAGLLVNPNDPEDIALKIMEIFNDKDIQERLITLGKKRVKSWTRVGFTEKVKEIINEL